MYYGQNEEDRYIRAAFDGQTHGYFVDVGAYDGVKFSNTLLLEEQGWTGLCVEPHKVTFAKLKRKRQNSICVYGACVGDKTLTTAIYKDPGIVMLGGLAPDEPTIRANLTDAQGIEFRGYIETEVPAFTLNTLLLEHLGRGKTVDFVSIDTEGTELDVLRGFDLGLWIPRLLCVEHAHCDAVELEAYMACMGYVMARVVGDNTFYANSYGMVDLVRSVVE